MSCVAEGDPVTAGIENAIAPPPLIPEFSVEDQEPSGCQERKRLMSSFLFCSKDFRINC